MVKTKWFPPYTKGPDGDLRPAIKERSLNSHAGVYFLRRRGSKKIEYVGQSQTQLKKTIYRHFQVWNDRRENTGRHFDRTVYPKIGYEIRFVSCTPGQAARMEKFLIRRLQPPGNSIKYDAYTQKEETAVTKDFERYETAETLNPEAFLVDF